mgnify:CR=1 FL=1
MDNSKLIISKNEESYESITNWDQLTDIKLDLLRGIYGYGFEHPSPIQQEAISPLFKRKDIIAQAQSGTGKTGCFAIGCLQIINTEIKHPQALILSPTRELSYQSNNVIKEIGNQMKNFKSQLLVGGTSPDEDTEKLQENKPQIIVGCPGRVHDMLRRKALNLYHLKIIVLDEADEMLSQGFKEQVYNIFQYLPKDIQVSLFSATMPPELYSLTEKFMRDPIKILVKNDQLTLEGIRQYYVYLENDTQKYETIKDLFNSISVSQCIIYCNSVRRVNDLYEVMVTDGFPVCQIHSNMTKQDRDNSYQEFKNGSFRVLISSNLTARGIDIQQVSTVINFDLPKDIHTYIHRIGRSGRWGRKGMGINFITQRDTRKLKEIQDYYNTLIDVLPENFMDI